MENNFLGIYGPPIIEYEGTGRIYLDSSEIIEGKFKCIQLNNTEIYIEMFDCIPVGRAGLPIGDFLKVKSFEGRLGNGRKINTGDWVANIGHSVEIQNSGGTKVRILLQAQLIVLGPEVSSEANFASIKFALTNFTFFDIPLDNNKQNYKFSNLTYNIQSVKNYRAAEAKMVASNACTITAYLEIEANEQPWEELIDVCNDLCLLFSLAKGTRINWAYLDLFDNNGRKIHTLHTRNNTTNFNGVLELIDSKVPLDLHDFIKATYANFISIKTDYRLRDIINALTESKSGGLAFIAALNASSIIEALRATWAGKNSRSFIFDETNFSQNITGKIKIEIERILKALKRSSKERKEIYEKIAELNRPAFQAVLKEMVMDLNADIGTGENPPGRIDEIKKFVSERDLLVHQGKFSSIDEIKELYQILSIVDRLLLSLLHYKGPYYDYRSEERITPPEIGNFDLDLDNGEAKRE